MTSPITARKPPAGKHDVSLQVVRPLQTLREQAVTNLRSAIVEGRFRPGERLVERALCDVLGVSRTLVREALRQLEAEGWVENAPYRGPAVATVTPDEARQIYEVRIGLEGLAAQLFAERASEDQVTRLKAACARMERVFAGRDLIAQRDSVEVFYAVMLEGAGNALLSSYVQSQRARLTQLRTLSLSRPARPAVSIVEKQELLAALVARDGPTARETSERHLRKAAEATAAALAEQDPEIATPVRRPRRATL